jgi:hypothetical protein
MRDDGVQKVLGKLADREICAACADTFIAILDAVRALHLAPDDAANDAGDDSGRPS